MALSECSVISCTKRSLVGPLIIAAKILLKVKISCAKIVHSLLYPLLLGAVYIGGMIMTAMGHGASRGGFTSIEGVRTLFSADVGMLIGWTHYRSLIFCWRMGSERRAAMRL